MSVLFHTVLLLGWPAYAAQQASELKRAPPGLPTVTTTTGSLHMVAREGDNVLIECNVTGQHNDVQWFNSKGALTGEGGALLLGMIEKTRLSILFSFHLCSSFPAFFFLSFLSVVFSR